MGGGRFVERSFFQFRFHPLQLVHALFDGADGFKILGEFLLVGIAQFARQGVRVGEDQVGDISEILNVLRAEQATVGLARIADGGRNMAGAIP